MKRNLESGRYLLMNCCNSFSMLCEILSRYDSLKVNGYKFGFGFLDVGKTFCSRIVLRICL